MVKHEMQWTVSWFRKHEDIWRKRFETVEDSGNAGGLRCYALKQSQLWKKLGVHAQTLYRAAGQVDFI